MKGRLARDEGAVEALRFYRRTMRALLARLDGRGRWRCWLAVTPDAAAKDVRLWPATWTPLPQGSGDLGARMGRTMRTLPPGPVVIVGTDVPDLRSEHVAQAFKALGRFDAVFGPAVDGGYWLVGLRRSPRTPEIFGGVRWSTPFALADTRANLGPLSAAMLETLEDIDDGPALRRWGRAAAG